MDDYTLEEVQLQDRLVLAEKEYAGANWTAAEEWRIKNLYSKLRPSDEAFQKALDKYEIIVYSVTRKREADKQRRDVWHRLQGVL